MKNLILFLFIIFATSVNAQSIETAKEYPTGYISTNYYSTGNTIMTVDGVLYMACDDVPIILLKYPAMNTRTEFEVPSTVRRIANNAFQGTKYLKTLKLHSTVTYGSYVKMTIGESAFNDSSIESFIVIEADENSSR